MREYDSHGQTIPEPHATDVDTSKKSFANLTQTVLKLTDVTFIEVADVTAYHYSKCIEPFDGVFQPLTGQRVISTQAIGTNGLSSSRLSRFRPQGMDRQRASTQLAYLCLARTQFVLLCPRSEYLSGIRVLLGHTYGFCVCIAHS